MTDGQSDGQSDSSGAAEAVAGLRRLGRLLSFLFRSGFRAPKDFHLWEWMGVLEAEN